MGEFTSGILGSKRNLKIHLVCWDPEDEAIYQNLINKPTNLNDFKNGPEYLRKPNFLNEFVTETERYYCRSNLQLGTLSVQNYDNVKMFGSNATFDFTNCMGDFSFFGNTNSNELLQCVDTNGKIEWYQIPHVSETNDEGLVKLIDSFKYDDYNPPTTRLVKERYDILNSNIDRLFEKLNNL